MDSFNLPHKAEVGEIIRVKGYEGILFLVLELLEEVSHDKSGSEPQVTYTCRNIDQPTEIKIIFDQDILSIVTTADKSEDYIARRRGGALPPAVQKEKKDVGKLQIDMQGLAKMFEEAKRKKEDAGKPNNNNAPRSPWAKEREEKRKAYEYIDFLLERYANLMAWRGVHSDEPEVLEEIDLEIEMIRAEFMEKTGEKVVQDGKFS